MKAITVKVLPWTEHRPRRFKAYTGERGPSLTLSEHDVPDGNDGQRHAYVAKKLCEKMQWKGEMVGGWTDAGYVFCFVESPVRTDHRLIAALEGVVRELKPVGPVKKIYHKLLAYEYASRMLQELKGVSS